MKANELRQLANSDLQAKITQFEENLFRLRCNLTIGQLEDSSAIRQARKDIARAKTILRQKDAEKS